MAFTLHDLVVVADLMFPDQQQHDAFLDFAVQTAVTTPTLAADLGWAGLGQLFLTNNN